MYLLVLFIAQSHGVFPAIIEEPFPTQISCYNTGFTMKARDPKRVIWFSCERMIDQEAGLLTRP